MGAEPEGGCRSDWRERRTLELRGKEEKKAILLQIVEITKEVDPLEWLHGYELNEEMVLESGETGRIWVPGDERLRREVLMMHHDGKIVGHLGMAGTLELVSRKYWWKELVEYT